jgi:outer membrane protein OmpA-like peptidoglycan-associated protein
MRLFVIFLLVVMRFEFHAQIKTTSLYFKTNESNLSVEQENSLIELSEQQKQKKIEILRIEAFCDTAGNISHNDLLAKKRLFSASKALLFSCKDQNCHSIGERYNTDTIPHYSMQNWRRVDITYKFLQQLSLEQEKPKPFTSVFDLLSIDSLRNVEIEPIVLKIQFVPGTDQLLDDTSYYELERLFQFMKNNPNAHAFIRGHVCCGSEPQLAYSRAYAVYTFLVRRAISQKRIEFKGFDNTIPLVWPEVNDADRQKNRRVDIIFSFPED